MILEGLSNGLTARQMASKFHITPGSIANHKWLMYKELGLVHQSRPGVRLVTLYIQHKKSNKNMKEIRFDETN